MRVRWGALVLMLCWMPNTFGQSFDEYATCSDATCSDSMGCGDACGVASGSGIDGWVSAEYLAWQLSGVDLPVLASRGPNGAGAGALDNVNTVALAGGSVLDDVRNGWRISGGLWLGQCRSIALFADYADLDNEQYNFLSAPTAGQTVVRPFFNSQSGDQDVELVSLDNELDGTVRIAASDDFNVAGVGLGGCLWQWCGCCPGDGTQIRWITGYRHYAYDSTLSINENLTVLPNTTAPLIPGTNILVSDNFAVENEFHGGDLGLTARIDRNCWWFDALARMSIGSNRRTVRIDGSTTNIVPNVGTSVLAGGLLTSSETNIGVYEDSQTLVIPEFRLGLGTQVTPHLSARVGYSVIIWNDVMTVADALPPNLATDPRNLPPVTTGGGADPAFAGFGGSNFVAHGLDAGLLLSF